MLITSQKVKKKRLMDKLATLKKKFKNFSKGNSINKIGLIEGRFQHVRIWRQTKRYS